MQHYCYHTDKQAPLSPYQAWVINKLARILLATRSKERLKQAIKAKQTEFSRYTYENQRKTALIGA